MIDFEMYYIINFPLGSSNLYKNDFVVVLSHFSLLNYINLQNT